MMSSNPAIGSRAPNIDPTLCAGYLAESADSAVSDNEKWPIWVRLVVIIGLSAGLWALIIYGLLAIF